MGTARFFRRFDGIAPRRLSAPTVQPRSLTLQLATTAAATATT
jgi:hypothetical protein